MFVGRVVQTGALQFGFFGCRRHGALLNFTGKRSIVHCNNNAKKINWGQIPIISSLHGMNIIQGHIKNKS
jgi:hypothetical protein